MFFELVGAVVLGVSLGGMTWGARKFTRGKVPLGAVPAAAGLGIIAYASWMDYDWSTQAMANLPEGMTVVREVEGTTWYKPWTLAIPPLERFVAVDAAGAQTNPQQPDLRLADLYLYDRRAPVGRLSVVVDCAAQRMTPLREGFEADGAPRDPLWGALPEGDGTARALCPLQG